MPKGVYVHKKGRIFSEVHKRKLSEAAKGKVISEETRKRLSESHKGLPNPNKGKTDLFRHTEEAKRKIADASRGNTYCLGRHLSEEHKRKIGIKSKGRKVSEETKEKIRKFLTGRKRPELTGENNPMHTHPNAYKSKFGKVGFREDLGVFLKSTWEANMMRIFKYLGLHVQYEPQSFRLSDGSTYRPDFLIHETGGLIEVKGRWLKDAWKRFSMFKREYPDLSIELIDSIKYKEYFKKYSKIIELER